MASADPRDELNCSICLNLCTDSVSLICGHNFCHSCFAKELNTSHGSRGFPCSTCRAEYQERPPLEKKRKLGNIEQRLSTSNVEETRIFCTYCIKSLVPAVKSCLQCKISLCDDHLTVHNRTMDHILTEPTNSFNIKECSIHKKVLEYFCPQDAACLCVSCCLADEHKGHKIERLVDAFKKKKNDLGKYLNELNPQNAEIQTKLQNLNNHKCNIQEKASAKKKNTSEIFMDLKMQLEMAEKKTLREISRQEKIVSKISDLIKKLEVKKDELSRKMRHLEEMCNVTDPIRLLQESDITVCGQGDGADTDEDGKIKSEDDLDEVLISMTLHRSLRDNFTNVTSQLGFQVPDILLDENTANSFVKLSEDLKTATESRDKQNRPESSGRFLDYSQVLSKCGFSSGRHYWEVEWDKIGDCIIGLSYPSIKKKGRLSGIGDTDKSWSLIMDTICKSSHNSLQIPLNIQPTCPTLGVFLDYEAGRLSFYELCDPIRHLHTFTASFTEPLHVAFYMNKGASLTIRS
ncbi:E3 ubiquitin-protein ligase TRIM39-like [Hyla sarda]|uniref:E3 ubiquitin-protein ligase TRIM39-like n=1 Tax=Hyla sarda TaxID=327740 RepID=UPI0024C39FF2|nr:E3 ubiquitin-protein ligase TRIM39-like [Hyla sarda]